LSILQQQQNCLQQFSIYASNYNILLVSQGQKYKLKNNEC